MCTQSSERHKHERVAQCQSDHTADQEQVDGAIVNARDAKNREAGQEQRAAENAFEQIDGARADVADVSMEQVEANRPTEGGGQGCEFAVQSSPY